MALRQKKSKVNPEHTRLQRLSLWFFHRPRRTALICLVFVLFGGACYGTLLKREGFPSINTPFALGNGSYLVNNPAKVDNEIAKPLSAYLLKQDGVKSVQTQSFGNFYSAQVEYKEGTDATSRSKELGRAIAARHLLPEKATFSLEPYEFGFTSRGDNIVVSVYSNDGRASTEDLVKKGAIAGKFIQDQRLPLVHNASVIDPFEAAVDPLSGISVRNQKSFDRYGDRQGNNNTFHTSVVVGVKANKGADNIELDKQVTSAVAKLNTEPDFKGYHAVVSASFAPQINAQISELQKTLLEGFIAVLIVGSIVIAIRASILTVMSMLTVIATVNGLLYLFGYSLNTITLFALILGLSLIVDDTIIMVEALESQRKRQQSPDAAVSAATGKVSKAMIAATSTSALSFAPFLFVGGILGSFIRAIPITIIAALLISLFVALVFIPLFARFLLLGKKQMGKEHVHEVSAGIEAAIARFISGPMLWAKGSTKKLFGVGIVALIIGFGFIGAGGYLFSKVEFNIFPPAKDSDQISATITYRPDTDIEQAGKIADQVDTIMEQTVDANFVRASYYGQANIQTALLNVDITDYNKRSTTSLEYIKQLNSKFKNFAAADVKAASVDAGPPAADFTIEVNSGKNRAGAVKAANGIADYIKHKAVLKRVDGSIAKISDVAIGNTSIYTRNDDTAYVSVTVKFADTDTSTLVTLAKDSVKKEFTTQKMEQYGLTKDALIFDAGQEDENQDSFKTLALAFPALLFIIYLVLALQFRSLLQPLLIFMALPFSLFGITAGLYFTDNPFSFFAMLGFFALIGLSIKNTILLTDYANQSRRAGLGTVDAAHEALDERFRPLIATSLTAVFSLIPLAISSPFWEGLSVVLIFGLLSSTFLVITVFPYYYLGAEYLRQRVNRRTGLTWLLLTILCGIALGKAFIFAPFIAFLATYVMKRYTPLKLGRTR